MIETDDALRMLGSYSKWHMRNYFSYAIGFGIPFAWMSMSIIFIGDTPKYRCAVPENRTLNESIPRQCPEASSNINSSRGEQCQYEQCLIYTTPYNESTDFSNISVRETGPCTHGMWYDPDSGYISTIVTEWDLVCGYNWMVELSMTINNIGSWLGILFFTRLADIYGRKKVFCYCLWSNIIVATGQALAPNYITYSILAFIDGIQQQGCTASSAVLAIELFPTEQRNFALNAIEFFWAFGYISLVPFAYFIRNWRYLQLAITLPVLLTISYYWFLDESIPWLVAQGRYHEANATMRRAAKFNNIEIPDEVFTPLESEEHSDSKDKEGCWKKFWNRDANPEDARDLGVLDIFRNRTMAIWTVTLFVIWFANNLTYYAVNFTVTYLPGDRYLNYFLYGLMEIPAYALTWILLEKIGRVKPLCVFHLIAGTALIGTVIQTTEWGAQNQWLTITLSVMGKFFITCSYATIFVHTPEIYPTNVRNTGLGMCMGVSRLASVIGPYGRVLSRYSPWMTTVIVGSTSLVAGVLALTLPETRWMPLPQTINDIAQCKGKDLSKKAMYKLAMQEDMTMDVQGEGDGTGGKI